jgi:hypothetical protein
VVLGAYGVAVEKEITFRGAPERIANVYHYRITLPVANDYQSLADAVVARDKAAHQSSVTYKTVRVFGPTEGSEADNKMRLTADLSGGGTRVPAGPSLYPELTACVQIYVGRSPVKNRKVFVRKYIRLITAQTSNGIDPTTAATVGAERTFWQGWMNSNKQITSGGASFDMVTPKDVLVPASESAVCLTYARIRQMHQ